MRPAVLFEPSLESKDDFLGSFFGVVKASLPDERWPEYQGNPMLGILQLNLEDLVYRPPGTEDIRLLTLFVDSESYPEREGSWLLRTYRSLSKLKCLESPNRELEVRQVSLGPPALIEDYPCFEELAEDIEDELWDTFSEQHPTARGVKLGGWPSLVQSEISWAPQNEHPADPKYVLQIESLEEARWQWGHDGCAYLGRGTVKGRQNEWVFEWPCL
jgi:uncharacterized protein YwqG